jgi:hypothetical protein
MPKEFILHPSKIILNQTRTLSMVDEGEEIHVTTFSQ